MILCRASQHLCSKPRRRGSRIPVVSLKPVRQHEGGIVHGRRPCSSLGRQAVMAGPARRCPPAGIREVTPMPSRIEDYALIGDCRAVALVARDGSVDWLCTPRFDSAACFAALLGAPEHGRWFLAPAGPVRATRRRYREGTLVLETEFETDEGTVAVVDCMPAGGRGHDLVRRV